MRRAAKVDNNQAEITAALRAVGATVQPLHTIGKGCPDLLVGFRRNNYVLEVKFEAGLLTEAELCWLADWRGQAAVVRSVDEALRAISSLPGVGRL